MGEAWGTLRPPGHQCLCPPNEVESGLTEGLPKMPDLQLLKSGQSHAHQDGRSPQVWTRYQLWISLMVISPTLTSAYGVPQEQEGA